MSNTERTVNAVFKIISWLLLGIVVFMAVAVCHRYGFIACLAVVCAYFIGGLDYGVSTIGSKA